VADVVQPIVGADFLLKNRLLVDVFNGRLVQPGDWNFIRCDRTRQFVPRGIRAVEEASPYAALLHEFPALSRPELRLPPVCHGVEHCLETTGLPFRQPFRNLSPEKLEVAKKDFEELVRIGVCRRSSSPWASPLHMVEKKDKSWRPCGDFVRLNEITVHDSYPLPLLRNFAYNLAGSTKFSKIDLVKAYHQIPMRASDVPKTAIITPFGLFEYIRMPFGLKNSAQSFQRLMDRVTQGLKRVFVYLDDILVASATEEEHVDDLRQLFTRLSKHGLIINMAKCVFGVTQIEFLGHKVSGAGVQPLPGRLRALEEYEKPKDEKGLSRFLGIINYYHRFIRGCAELTREVSGLLPTTRKATTRPIAWTEDTEKAFRELKESLGRQATLAFPTPGAKLRVCTDASEFALGAVLEQETQQGVWQPLGFYSRKLRQPERNYSAFDRELLAVHQAIVHFREFLEGRDFHVLTDHKPLTTAMSSTSPTSLARRRRQWQYISEFTTDVRHLAGATNVVADAFSRLGSTEVVAAVREDSIEIRLAEAQARCMDCKRWSEPGTRPLGCPFTAEKCEGVNLLGLKEKECFRVLVPPDMRREIVQQIHELAHCGKKPTTRIIKAAYIWPNMTADIHTWVAACLACQRAKISKHNRARMERFLPPASRFTDVHVDIVGPLPQSEGQMYVLTMIDRFSRWPEAAPMPDMTAETCAKTFLMTWVARFGVPSIITSDQGRQFESDLWSTLMGLLGCKHQHTTAYHPQANGLIERFHRSLKSSLRAKLAHDSWVEELPVVLLGLRAAVKADIDCSPAQMLYGAALRLPGMMTSPTEATDCAGFLRRLQDCVKKFIFAETSWHTKENPQELRGLERADQVMLLVPPNTRGSLQPVYTGPHKVLSRSKKHFKIDYDGEEKVVTADRLKPAITEEGIIGEEGATTLTRSRTGRAVRRPARFR
jgi:hypothetical protein